MKDMLRSAVIAVAAAAVGMLPGVAPEAAAKPLKVFVLAGQSNMQGHAKVTTFDSMADDPKTAPILAELRDAEGKLRVCSNVWISSVGCAGDGPTGDVEQTGKLTAGFGASKEEIGPELTFGIYIAKLLGEPVLLIKTSWGGKSLHTDFRPPSAGPEEFSESIRGRWKEKGRDPEQEAAKIRQNGGVFYRRMIEHVRRVLADIKRVVPDYDPQQGYELAGFVWFQGWNDMVDSGTYHERMKPGGYDMYGQLMAQFIRDVRKDLSAPKMPFVIGVMGVGGLEGDGKAPQMYFRQAQSAPASLPEFKGNVVAVRTAPFWDDDLAKLQERKQKKETLTPEETKRLKGGVSNGGYHYLGAAKILAPIGKAFAEAMAGMQATAMQEKQ